MTKVEALQPVYDDKVNKILQLLQEGLSREEVAEQFRYTNSRSMGEYMRRKNFLWGKKEATYVPANTINDPLKAGTNKFPADKVRRVVMEINKEKTSPKEVALKIGFDDHLEMARYMKSKGFVWSQEMGNYVGDSQSLEPTNANDGIDDKLEESTSTGRTDSGEFQPLLEWLTTNRESIQELIEASVVTEATEQIPRFTLQGTLVTKSVHMTNTLDQMVRDFSKEKNIKQREMFEVALIDFFRKYGYMREVDTFLEQYG